MYISTFSFRLLFIVICVQITAGNVVPFSEHLLVSKKMHVNMANFVK